MNVKSCHAAEGAARQAGGSASSAAPPPSTPGLALPRGCLGAKGSQGQGSAMGVGSPHRARPGVRARPAGGRRSLGDFSLSGRGGRRFGPGGSAESKGGWRRAAGRSQRGWRARAAGRESRGLLRARVRAATECVAQHARQAIAGGDGARPKAQGRGGGGNERERKNTNETESNRR